MKNTQKKEHEVEDNSLNTDSLKKLEKKIQDLSSQILEITRTQEALSLTINDVNILRKNVSDFIEDIERKIDDIEYDIRMSNKEGQRQTDDIYSNIRNLESSVSLLESDISSIQSDIQALNSNITDLTLLK